MSSWHFAEVWEAVADTIPDATAQLQDERRFSWTDFERRADALAAALLGWGLDRRATFAQYLHSCPEYLEAVFAAFKLGVAPVNTNYRYGADELFYLWDNADTGIVVFHGTFSDRIGGLRTRVPRVQRWLWVDDGSGACPPWAVPYEDVVSTQRAGRTVPPWGRSSEDLYISYTGGTTGLPKGVMWRHDDLFVVLNRTAAVRYPEDGGAADVSTQLTKPGPVFVPCAPLMHNMGMVTAMATLSSGGSVVTLPGRSFAAGELLDLVDRERVTIIAIVGDVFAKPILAALDAEPRRWDISSLRIITSSGAMMSPETKQGLLRHNPRLIVVDTLGSTEVIGLARSVVSTENAATTGAFTVGRETRVDANGHDLVPGSGAIGLLAHRGRGSIGYYKDEAKTAAAVKMIDGERWTVVGDFASVEADGSLRLLGRGSQCINTGGEKVFAEEVEEVLKTHPDVVDCACVGVPHEVFGEAVIALVELRPGAMHDEPALISHVKARLAGYKVPKRAYAMGSLQRGPNGKLDYRALRERALELT